MSWICRLLQLGLIVIALWLSPEHHFTHDRLVVIVGTLSIFFFVVLFHEIGHAIVLWLAGGRMLSICVMGLRLDCRPIRLSWGSFGIGGDLGGCVNPDYENWNPSRRQLISMFAGGPLANFILAAIFLLWANLLSEPPSVSEAELYTMSQLNYEILTDQWNSYRHTKGIFYSIATYSIFLGLYNLIPMPGSDGDWIFRLVTWRDTEAETT